MAAAQIQLQGVSKRYGTVTAVDDVSLTIEAGSLTTLLGPSGCGKTTMLRMLAGLELASAGRILIGGRDVTHVGAAGRNVTMVFQSYALFPHMTVFDNVAYGLRLAGCARAEVQERAMAGLALTGLDAYARRWPSELSGGQQQRVAIARALVLEPEVLLFDEPLSNLDTQLRRMLRKEIRELQQRLQLTVVYVTHDQAEALAISDQVVLMHRGKVAQASTPQGIYRAPRDAFVATFLGDCNLAPVRLMAIEGALGRVSMGGLELRLPHCGQVPGPVQLAMRPQALRLAGAGQAGGVAAEITSVTFLGGLLEIELRTAFGPWLVHAAPQAGLAPGMAVTVMLDTSSMALLAA